MDNKNYILRLKTEFFLEEIASFAEISVEEVEQYIKENCLN